MWRGCVLGLPVLNPLDQIIDRCVPSFNMFFLYYRFGYLRGGYHEMESFFDIVFLN